MKSKGTWDAFQQKPSTKHRATQFWNYSKMATDKSLVKVSDKVDWLTEWDNYIKMGQNTRAPSVSKKKSSLYQLPRSNLWPMSPSRI